MGAAVRTTPSYGRIRNRRPQATHHPSARYAAPRRPPSTNQAPRTFTTTVKVIKADGLPKEIEGRELDLAYQGPDHLRIGAKWDRHSYVACRNGQEVWIYAPGKKFGLVGSPDQAPFSTVPARSEESR